MREDQFNLILNLKNLRLDHTEPKLIMTGLRSAHIVSLKLAAIIRV